MLEVFVLGFFGFKICFLFFGIEFFLNLFEVVFIFFIFGCFDIEERLLLCVFCEVVVLNFFVNLFMFFFVSCIDFLMFFLLDFIRFLEDILVILGVFLCI